MENCIGVVPRRWPGPWYPWGVTDIHYLVLSALLTWVMIFSASLLRSRGWTPGGLKVALSNRDAVPEPSPMAARCDRAAKNMLENMVLFIAVFVAARAAGVPASEITVGAAIFFYARVAYFVVYLVGIPYLRTLIWTIALGGAGWIAFRAIATARGY